MFRVTARTLLELGSELISSDIIAFYELIKNGFDAKTTSGVEIHFNVILRRNDYLSLCAHAKKAGSKLPDLKAEAIGKLNNDVELDLLTRAQTTIESVSKLESFIPTLEAIYRESTIVISDTGLGMSIDDLNDCFLVIGTASRKRAVDAALKSKAEKSPFLGEKGIGRLSAMRLGNQLRVETARLNDTQLNLLEIDWSQFSNLDVMLDEIQISPSLGRVKPTPNWSGTKIIISDLSEDWTSNRLHQLAKLEFARLTDPFLDEKNRPRIALFWNGNRVAIPSMNRSLLDHAHARVVGSYSVIDGIPKLSYELEAIDLDFEHPKEIENITISAPDLEGLLSGVSRSIPDIALSDVGPFSFEAYWYNRRRLTGVDSIGKKATVKELQERWSGIQLFRDSFRVFPYGEDEDDWLSLDRKALSRSGYVLNKTQFVGRVSISRTQNPQLVDQTNREGLRETPEQQVLIEVMKIVIQHGLFGFLKDLQRRYKDQKPEWPDPKSEVTDLQSRADSALKKLKKLAPKEGRDAVVDLEQTLHEFREFANRASLRIAEVEQESRQMIEMAGVGLMVEVVAHELARASENAIENLEALRGKAVPDEVRTRLESLRAQMKSLSKRVRILDPLSVAGRQRSERFSLGDLIKQTLEAHEGQFKRHGIQLELNLPKSPVHVTAVKGMVVQVLENLISNSKYWLKMRQVRLKGHVPTIRIAIQDGPATMLYEDNGQGIAPDNREKVFKAFFSLKEKSKRRGLGLFIARECAETCGGTLHLDDRLDPDTNRLHRFVLELP
jgi:signal transduction histidine kinase